MSCPLIVALLSLATIALAMAQAPITTTMMTTETPLAFRSCKALDKFNETALMEAKTFVRNLDECTESNENKTYVASVLVELFNKLNTTRHEIANLTDYPEMMNRISQCASNTTAFHFNASEARKHFGLPNTVSFKFQMLECKKSLELADCVESVYAGNLNATTKRHKNAYMRLFDGIAPFCRKAMIRDDNNSGKYCLPSFSLILGSALMILLKLLL